MFEKCHLDFARAVSGNALDTMLLQSTRSEQERIAQAAQKLSQILSLRGRVRSPQPSEMRLLALGLAYRAPGVGGGAGEVRLHDIFERKLAEALRRVARSGKRIIAASDTALSQASLIELIDEFVGEDLFDEIYISAEAGAELGYQSARRFHRTPEGVVASNLDVSVFGYAKTLASHPMLKGPLVVIGEGLPRLRKPWPPPSRLERHRARRSRARRGRILPCLEDSNDPPISSNPIARPPLKHLQGWHHSKSVFDGSSAYCGAKARSTAHFRGSGTRMPESSARRSSPSHA